MRRSLSNQVKASDEGARRVRGARQNQEWWSRAPAASACEAEYRVDKRVGDLEVNCAAQARPGHSAHDVTWHGQHMEKSLGVMGQVGAELREDASGMRAPWFRWCAVALDRFVCL